MVYEKSGQQKGKVSHYLFRNEKENLSKIKVYCIIEIKITHQITKLSVELLDSGLVRPT